MLADFEGLTGYIPAGHIKSNIVTNTSGDDSNKNNLPQRESPMEYFKNALPPEICNIGSTVLLCILENAVVDDLVVMAANQQTINPLIISMREHLNDEGRHKVFFQKMLTYIWGAISEEDRVVLGSTIATYALQSTPKNSLEKQIQSNVKFLSKFNLSDSAVEAMAYDAAIAKSSKLLYEDPQIKGLMSLMNVAGITSHAPTHQIFLDNNLIAA
jgi:hypothetical protein